MSFKRGDLIFGNIDNGYAITNEGMVVGVVTDEYECGYDIEVRIIRHINPSKVGEHYKVINSDDLFTKVPISILKNINGMDARSIFNLEIYIRR